MDSCFRRNDSSVIRRWLVSGIETIDKRGHGTTVGKLIFIVDKGEKNEKGKNNFLHFNSNPS